MGENWSQYPTSSGRDTRTPAKSLPPLSAFHRRTDGARIGPCPKCGGDKWWDNRPAKRAAHRAAHEPDFACVRCRFGRREDDPEWEVWEPAATVVLPVAYQLGVCQGITKAGNPCRAGAQRDQLYCPQHIPEGSSQKRPGQ